MNFTSFGFYHNFRIQIKTLIIITVNDTDKVMSAKLFLCTWAQHTRISINKSHFVLFAFKVKEHAGEERIVPYL